MVQFLSGGPQEWNWQWVLTQRMARNFFNWTQLSSHEVLDIEIPDDALMYHCNSCKSPILHCHDIVSTHYHGAHGPAFLVDHLYNVAEHQTAYTTAFITGAYRVCNVQCAGCGITLGKKYIVAHELANRFKVGKYLLEQTMVSLPDCCSSKKGCCASSKGWRNHMACVCCTQHLQSRILPLVSLMTHDFHPGRARGLRESLIDEEHLFRCPIPSCPPPDCTRLWRRSQAVGNDLRLELLERALSERLCAMCKVLPGVDVEVLAAFANAVAMCLAAALIERHTRSSRRPRLDRGSPRGVQLDVDIINALARPTRWSIITPAAIAVCKDFSSARNLAEALQQTWNPQSQVESLCAERLVKLLTRSLSLKNKERCALAESMGVASSSGCSWFSCRISI